MFVFLLLALGVSCILPVCSGTPFKLPFSNISLCFCLSKKKVFFGRRIPHPSLVLLFSINFFLCRFLSKKKRKKEPDQLMKSNKDIELSPVNWYSN